MIKLHSTDIDRDQEEYIDPAHSRHLLGMVISGIGIGFLLTIGIAVALINADAIDRFFSEVVKSIFL